MKARVEFRGGAWGDVTDVSFRDGRIVLTVNVPRPHPAFDAQYWKLYGDDGDLVLMVTETAGGHEPVPAFAADVEGLTTVFLPMAISPPGSGYPTAVGPIRRTAV